MKKHYLIIAIAIMSMALMSCSFSFDGESFGGKTIKGDGHVVTRNYDVTAFNDISASLPATINFTIGDDYHCTVRVDENILEYLEIKAKGNELLLGKTKEGKNVNLRATEFVIDITAPSLGLINLAGSGKFNVRSALNVKKLEVNLAGSGDVFFKEPVTVNEINLNVAGSGALKCNELVADGLYGNIAGSGELKVLQGLSRKPRRVWQALVTAIWLATLTI